MHSVRELLEQADRMGVRVRETRLPDGVLGLYSEARRLILIDEDLNGRQRRCALQHELVHAEHRDQACHGLADTRVERRTRRETARRLISTADYAAAERIHEDGDPRALALELGVTLQVLDDYREILDLSGIGVSESSPLVVF